MNKPILVLQYPDPKLGRTVALAATSDPRVLSKFKEVVLEEATLNAIDENSDRVITIQNEIELDRLSKVLRELIPDA